MLEVSCVSESSDIFLSGHLLKCLITLHCSESDSLGSSCQSKEPECLAWLSAQVQCFCQTNSQVVLSHTEQCGDGEVVGRTAYRPGVGERGHLLLTTAAQILACDVQLKPGQSHTVSYNQRLPTDLPPSYRGHAVRYSYKIAIAAQRLGGSVRLLRVPIRILTTHGYGGRVDNACYDCDSPFDTDNVMPSNPFLNENDSGMDGIAGISRKIFDDSFELKPLQLLQLSTGKRSLNLFNITNQHGRVLKISVFKLSFRLGEDIVAVLDFSDAQVACVQYSVRLESVETVTENHQLSKHPGKYRPHVQQYSKSHQVCLNLRHTNVSLPIPTNVTAGFSSSIVRLDWRVHFEFVVRTDSAPELDSDGIYWQAPQTMSVETMIWDLPIVVHPACPAYLHQPLLTTDQQTHCMKV